MNNKLLKSLTEWLTSLKEAAKKDEQFSIAWFEPTKDSPFCIIGGWLDGFSKDYSDLICISKSNPTYVMCVKIAINDGPYAYTDFEIMNMPYDPKTGEVDDVCIALEYDDDVASLAQFLLTELDRINQEHADIDL